ncbi:JAB domain-containing protein [Noviherbaspirillum sedimenti]|uniref:DNA repair protein RadC n=1 Tax=Noviherbaspirillum sedimenti TaxID=2320865 RepID=A0A3A3GI63_9BURK|nr:DNA repair protein RadC [Noviherbaspirillum sedimenti]RJG00590.1 DNA repair protein RadC [Noviherbaspirillum sedimenti]
MKKISSMSRAQLTSELVAVPQPTMIAELSAALAAPYDMVARASHETLVQRRLAIARELLLRDLAEQMQGRSVLSSPGIVRDWLRLHCGHVEHEVFLALYLDARNCLIEAQELFRGTLTHTSVYPREVVKAALARNAASLIVAHNHPSGSTTPSQADQMLTTMLKSALELVEIRLNDHCIVAGSEVLSFAEQGML